jgi:hypothetical protein
MYDPRCYDLAEYFLGAEDHEEVAKLAQVIQDAIENWFDGKED